MRAGGGVRWVGEQQRFPPSSLPWPFAFWLPQMFFSAPWSQQVMGSEQGGLGRAAAGLGALEPSPPTPPSPFCSPQRCGVPRPWPKPAQPPAMGTCCPWGAGMRWDSGGASTPMPAAPPAPLPAPAQPSPPVPRATSPAPLPTVPTPPPPSAAPHSPLIAPELGGGGCNPAPTQASPPRFPHPPRHFFSRQASASGQHGRGCSPPPAPRSQNFLGSLQKQSQWPSIPTAARSPMASAHAGWGNG